ncbi:MAG: hypothetical protein ACM3TN_23975, partial [Alphaproteobacteria bacterium]
MSKGALGLTAGYWPEDVYRYLAVPGITLDDGLVARPGKRTPDRPALIGHQGPVSYKQLIADIDQVMKAVLTCLEGKSGRIVVALNDPLEVVRVVFGALKARSTVFLMNVSLAPEVLAPQLQKFSPDFAIADDAFRRVIQT